MNRLKSKMPTGSVAQNPKNELRAELVRQRPHQANLTARHARTTGIARTSLLLLALGGLAACQQPQAGNDPNALYAYLENKHTFIVSHVFTEDIYQNSFGAQFSAVRNPDAPASGTFTCFYEIRLDQQQMEHCAAKTGITGFTQPGGNAETGAGALTETDVWRLMAINPDKVSGIHPNVIPTTELIYNIRNQWDSNVEAIQADLQLQAAQTALNSSNVTRANLIDLSNAGNLLQGVLGGFLKQNQQPVQQAATNSAACLAVQRAAPNPLQSLTGTLLGFVGNWLGDRVGVLKEGIGQAALGLGLGYLNNMIGKALNPNASALEEAKEQCRRDIAAGVQGDGQSPQQVSPQTVLQSAAAIQNNDVNALRALLEKEIERDVNAMTAENAAVARQLAPTFSPLTAQKLHAIRENIKKAANSSQSLNSMNGATCLAAQNFATDVLKLALSEANTGDTIPRLNSWTGCAGGAAAVTQTGGSETPATNDQPTTTPQSSAANTPSSNSSAPGENETNTKPEENTTPRASSTNTTPGTQPSPVAPDSTQTPVLQSADLGSQITQLQAALEAANRRIDELQQQSLQTNEPLPDTQTTLQSGGLTAVQQAMGLSPAICFTAEGFSAEEKINSSGFLAEELQKRTETCREPLGSNTDKDTYGRFSDDLRRTCAERSSKEVTAQATCFCSCRWQTSFLDYLKSLSNR